MGLDQPAPVRFVSWIWGLLHGDFGRSYTYDVPVMELVLERLEVSLPLALMAIILSTAIALPVGTIAASKRGGIVDALIMAGSQIGLAIPNFWFAILLILLFSINLGWLPAGGFVHFEEGWSAALQSLILPRP